MLQIAHGAAVALMVYERVPMYAQPSRIITYIARRWPTAILRACR